MANPTVILIPLCFGLQLGMSQVALAQEVYPSRAITIINPFPPGGTSEIVTRPLAAALEPIVKQPVVVETKAGAAGAVGAQFVAAAAPDGYTLLSHITSLSGFAEVDKLFGRKPKFTRADFIPIARFTAELAGCADIEGARLRNRILRLGWAVRSKAHTGEHRDVPAGCLEASVAHGSIQEHARKRRIGLGVS